MKDLLALLRRFGLIAFVAFCLYPYFAYAVNSALHAAFGVYLCNGCLLPYGICTFGILTRESFAELRRLVLNFRTVTAHLSPREVFKRRHSIRRFFLDQVPLLNGGILAGWNMVLVNGGIILTVAAPWYRRAAVYFASLVLRSLAVTRSLRAIPETVWAGDFTIPSPLVAMYSFYTHPLSLKLFGGLMDLFYLDGVQIYTPGFVAQKLCVDGLGCLYLFAGGLLPGQTVYLALGHLPAESVQAMCLELNDKFGLNGTVVADPNLAGPDRVRIVFPGKQDYFTEILRGDYFSQIFRPR